MKRSPRIQKNFVLQHDHSDCGVACLLSITEYYGGKADRNRLRRLSGTGPHGTTLLGLLEASRELGFDSEGVELDLEALSALDEPAILHVVTEGRSHFIVSYGKTQNKWTIGDPAIGVLQIDESLLQSLWQSRAALILRPGHKFLTKGTIKGQKRKAFSGFIKTDSYALVTAILAGIVCTILGLSTAMFSQKLVDSILPSGEAEALISGIVALGLLLVARAFLNRFRRDLLVLQRKHFNLRLTGSFISRIFGLPRQLFDSYSTGDIISRLHDTAVIQDTLANITLNALDDMLLLIIGGSLLISYSPLSALVMVILAVLLFLLVSRFDPVLELHQYELKTAFSNTERYAIEYLKGMDAVKENDRQHFFADRLMDAFHAYQNTTFTFGGLTNRLAIFAELGGLTALLLIMGTAARQVISNGLSPGTFVAIMSVCGALLPAILRLNSSRINLRAASVSFSRMYEMLSLGDNKPNDDEAVLDPFVFRSLEASNVSFRFPGRSLILGGVNLEVHAGELTLLTGSNGAGKTTLLLLLQKFYLPTSGRISMNGIPLEQVPDFRLRNTIAYVPQDVKLFPLSVCQNIVFGQEISAEQFDRFCETYGFDKFFSSLPHGLFTMIGENGIKLSGGQKQMVGLARALLRSPKLLLLDEPTASMDLEAERKVIDLLIKLKSEGLAIVMVTHRIHLLNRYADRLYMM